MYISPVLRLFKVLSDTPNGLIGGGAGFAAAAAAAAWVGGCVVLF
jgi:hypothetical protein